MDTITIIFLFVLAWFSLQIGQIFFALILALAAVLVLLGGSAKQAGIIKESKGRQQITIGGGSTFESGYRVGVRPDWPAKPVGYWMDLGVGQFVEACVKLLEKAVGAED